MAVHTQVLVQPPAVHTQVVAQPPVAHIPAVVPRPAAMAEGKIDRAHIIMLPMTMRGKGELVDSPTNVTGVID